MAIVYLGGGVHFLSRLSAGSETEWGAMAGMGFLVAIFAGVGSTWLGMIPSLRTEKGD